LTNNELEFGLFATGNANNIKETLQGRIFINLSNPN